MLLCRRALLVCLFAWGLGLPGCASAPPELKPTRTVPITLNAAAKSTEVKAKVAEALKLSLPPAPTPGFQWQLFAHDARFLRQTSEVTTPSAGATAEVSFLVLRQSGRPSRIRFLLVSAQRQKESTPIDVHDVIVTIQP